MNRKGKKRRPPLKRACRDAAEDVEALKWWARQEDLRVRVNVLHCGSGSQTYHVMFEDRWGTRYLEWWPGTGWTWCKRTGARGKASGCREALDMAIDERNARVPEMHFPSRQEGPALSDAAGPSVWDLNELEANLPRG
jgi:hypothetical protein